MKYGLYLLVIGIVLSVSGCENVSPDAIELSVDFSWKGMKSCGWGNPEIHVSGAPGKTKKLKVSMYDHVYYHDHGTVTIPYKGTKIIAMGAHKEIQGPCPPDDPGQYKITVRAIDKNDVVIGIGSKARFFPEKK